MRKPERSKSGESKENDILLNIGKNVCLPPGTTCTVTTKKAVGRVSKAGTTNPGSKTTQHQQ